MPAVIHVPEWWPTLESNVKSNDLREVWRRYKSDGDERARERLVVAYSPLVKYVAGRIASGLPPHVDEADLISYGLGGLISAIERFDTTREIKFETYAITRIKGAIIDELRSIDWVPRSARTKARSVEGAYARLEASLGRAPTDAEVAAELQISEADLQSIFGQISYIGLVGLDEVISGGGGAPGEAPTLVETLPDRTE